MRAKGNSGDTGNQGQKYRQSTQGRFRGGFLWVNEKLKKIH